MPGLIQPDEISANANRGTYGLQTILNYLLLALPYTVLSIKIASTESSAIIQNIKQFVIIDIFSKFNSVHASLMAFSLTTFLRRMVIVTHVAYFSTLRYLQ